MLLSDDRGCEPKFDFLNRERTHHNFAEGARSEDLVKLVGFLLRKTRGLGKKGVRER